MKNTLFTNTNQRIIGRDKEIVSPGNLRLNHNALGRLTMKINNIRLSMFNTKANL